jgi:hypothetical protein
MGRRVGHGAHPKFVIHTGYNYIAKQSLFRGHFAHTLVAITRALSP